MVLSCRNWRIHKPLVYLKAVAKGPIVIRHL